jgi:uncharacterized protein (TIGR02117 family)
MRKIFKVLIRIVGSIIGAFLLYLSLAIILTAIPLDIDSKLDPNYTIFLSTNGVHSDLVVPVKSNVKDWSPDVNIENTIGKNMSLDYLAFGWGDKGFYMETPTWADLKFKTAFKATFGLGSSAIHATFCRRPSENSDCVKLQLSKEQYANLVRYIENTFLRNEEGRSIYIATKANYGPNDVFYEANGRYSLFKTCNTWTNTGLKVCGQRACVWTPYDKGIFWHYKR